MGNAHTQWDARRSDAITRSLPEKLLSIDINTRQRYERAPQPAFYVAQEIATPEGKQRIAWAVLKEQGQGRREWLYGFEVVLRVPVMHLGKPTGATMLTQQTRRWLESELTHLQLSIGFPRQPPVSPIGEKLPEADDAFEIQHQRMVRLGEAD
jgi:hypothetical protein